MSNIELMDVQGDVITLDHQDVTAVYVTRMHRIPVTTVCSKTLGTMYVQESPDKVRFMIDQEKSKLRSAPPTKSGVELIAEERARQISAEGWTPGHDDEHTDDEMPKAALCYIEEAIWGLYPLADMNPHPDWPWEPKWWKPSEPIRNLVKAGALIAAEIDRLIRAGQ